METDKNIEKEIQDKIEQLTPKGSLFESITYYSDEQLDNFYNKMTKEQAIYCLIEASKAGFRRGAFKMDEVEAISKALRLLGE
jgi:hypothetical protein